MAARNYIRNVTSGYLALGVQMLCSFAMVPLALHYLDKDAFGVWAIAAQAALWLQLVDAGMSGAVARYLIDFRQDPTPERAHACVATGFRILSVQGIAVAAIAAFMGFALTGPLKIPHEHAADFAKTMMLLGVYGAFSFVSKIFGSWFYAHQRLDLSNWISIGATVAEYLLMVFFFKQGSGLLSIAYARLIAYTASNVVYWACGVKLLHFPVRALFGSFDRGMMRTMGRFAMSCFVLTLGAQLIVASQSALVSRFLGVAAVAVWATGPKLFMLGQQLLARLWDYALPGLTERMARGEVAAVKAGFLGIFRLCAVGSGVLLGCAAAANPLFLHWWTSGKIEWSHRNDLLMIPLVFTFILSKCFTDFVIHTKRVGWMPWLMVAEGVMFLAAGAYFIPRHGLAALIVAAAVAGIVLRLPYAFTRVREALELLPRDFAAVGKSVIYGLLSLAGGYLVVAGTLSLTSRYPDLARLAAAGLFGGTLTAVLLWTLCLTPAWRQAVRAKLPLPLR